MRVRRELPDTVRSVTIDWQWFLWRVHARWDWFASLDVFSIRRLWKRGNQPGSIWRPGIWTGREYSNVVQNLVGVLVGWKLILSVL